MDVRQYFASVNHTILLNLLHHRVPDSTMWLCERIIGSFAEEHDEHRCGIPLGNVTSQLFANVYLHELDHFVAHELRIRRYARYMDDWIVVGRDRSALEEIAMRCRVFLRDQLRLDAPERKTSLVPVTRGVDWLGFVLFPHHRVLRTATMRRMRHRVRERVFAYLDDGMPYDDLRATFASYDGLLRCARNERMRDDLILVQCMC